ncbi:hypothetical protein [Microbispora sp. H10836]|uniref:hypothetical protein n=1 Tax=Microbispora sp. H10836 TaxID=2729106 RepID=UPI001B8CEA61|nr:hypothetical protein [Microbispora sp. H10836]
MIAAANAIWSPASCCSTWVTDHFSQGVAASRLPGATPAFLNRIVDADVHSLTVHLAGTFTPTEEMRRDAQRAGALMGRLVERARCGAGERPGPLWPCPARP